MCPREGYDDKMRCGLREVVEEVVGGDSRVSSADEPCVSWRS